MMPQLQHETESLEPSGGKAKLCRELFHLALAFFCQLFLIFYVLSLPFLGSAAVALLFCAETLPGLVFAVCALCLLLLPASLVFAWWRADRRQRFLPAVVLLLGAVGLYITLLVLAPTGKGIDGGEVGSYWPDRPAYPRYSLFNLLPEGDQVRLGVCLFGSTGLVIDADQAERVGAMTDRIYREMREHEEYAGLGSAMHYAWTDGLGGATGSGHLFYFVPKHEPGERLPLVLFLHGSAGNFRSYLYCWQHFCEHYRCVVVCPTFGAGNWHKPGGTDTVAQARDYALKNFPVDTKRIYLVALSNGGRGATRVARASPADYRGVVFISGVIEADVFGSARFVKGWKGRPVLIIHGEKDRRIPIGLIDDANTTMVENGAQVTYHVYSEEDHFLMYGSVERVYQDLAAWMRENETTPRQ